MIEYGWEITLLMAPSMLNETVKIEFFINNLLLLKIILSIRCQFLVQSYLLFQCHSLL